MSSGNAFFLYLLFCGIIKNVPIVSSNIWAIPACAKIRQFIANTGKFDFHHHLFSEALRSTLDGLGFHAAFLIVINFLPDSSLAFRARSVLTSVTGALSRKKSPNKGAGGNVSTRSTLSWRQMGTSEGTTDSREAKPFRQLHSCTSRRKRSR